MSESRPLLAHDSAEDNDPGSGLRDRAAKLLESNIFHNLVTALVTIDAGCVLADLAYTLLSQDCATVDPPPWLEVLSHVSLTITTLFLIEIPLTLWAFGLHFYNPFGDVPYAALHLFDALIIVITFMLEVMLKGRERELAGLLIVLRLWRLVKLVGGVAVGTGEMGEENAKELGVVRRKLEEATASLVAIRDENQKLKQRLVLLEANSFD